MANMALRVSLYRLARGAAFALLAAMLLIRLGPLCETMAMASTTVASRTMECAGTPINAPARKTPPASCATPCVAVPGETIADVDQVPFTPLSPWAVAHTSLSSLTDAPATPPPQNV